MLDGVDGNHLLIGSSMTICDESSGDNSADTNVEELEPTIQSLELDQKFNDAESYLIESGEISSDGGGKFICIIPFEERIFHQICLFLIAFDAVSGNVPVTMAVNPAENSDVSQF